MPDPTGPCYIDTSAFVKFYVNEAGSKKLARWFGPRVAGVTPSLPLYTSSLGYPEAMSAIARKRNTGALPARAVLGVWNRIVMDFVAPRPMYRLIQPSETVVMRAAHLVGQHGLRAYDAVHLASALRVWSELQNPAAFTFVSSDVRLLVAARAMSLQVADPTS